MSDKKIAVLVATMGCCDYEHLIIQMNIQTESVIANQTNKFLIKTFYINGKQIKTISTDTVGIGRNRNTALRYAEKEICVLADDDMCFVNGYEQIVLNVFEHNPSADVIIFNLGNCGTNRRINSSIKKINSLNYMNYGAARIAFKRKSIMYNSICFNEFFGGNVEHMAGEDTLFLHDCLRKGLKIVAVPDVIAKLENKRESTWNKGFTEKMFYDKGVLMALTHKKLGLFLGIILLIKNAKLYELNKLKVLSFIRGWKFIIKKKYSKG